MPNKRKSKGQQAGSDLAAPKEIHKGMKLPSVDHVVRHVPWARLRKDEDDNVLGVLPQALQLRSGETGLSVNWLERYPGDRNARIQAVVHSIRANLDIRPKSAFGIGNVGKLDICCRENGAPVKIVYAPTAGNPSHALVCDLPQDDLALLALVAEGVFDVLVHNKDIP